jgi:hypothetical protein
MPRGVGTTAARVSVSAADAVSTQSYGY